MMSRGVTDRVDVIGRKMVKLPFGARFTAEQSSLEEGSRGHDDFNDSASANAEADLENAVLKLNVGRFVNVENSIKGCGHTLALSVTQTTERFGFIPSTLNPGLTQVKLAATSAAAGRSIAPCMLRPPFSDGS